MGCANSKSNRNKKSSQTSQRNFQSQNQDEQVEVHGQKQQQQQEKQSSAPKGGLIQQAKEAKQNYDDNKKNKWINEVYIQETDLFKEHKQWFDLYEPQNQKNNGQKNSSQSSSDYLQKTIKKNMSESLQKTIVQTIIEQIGTAIELASKFVQQQEPLMYSFMNALVALLMTYRFQYKDNDKFSYIRGKAMDRFSYTFINCMDQEAKKIDAASQGTIQPDTVNQIIDKQVQLMFNQINDQKEQIFKRVREHSLFAATGQQGKEVDEGVTQVIEALQIYGEKKLLLLIDMIKAQIPMILQEVSKQQNQIRQQFAQQAQEQGIQEPSEEYIKNTRDQLLVQSNSYFEQLDKNISKFVQQFVDMVFQMAQEDVPEEE